MDIEESRRLTHPAWLVFTTLRDKTPELVTILPHVDSVESLVREDNPPLVYMHNRWQASESGVPKILRPFLKREMLAWFDRATWNEELLQCSWEHEIVVAKRFFVSRGTTRITPDGDDHSIFTINAFFEVDPEHLPGVPRFIAEKIKTPVEKFIANALRPSLTSIVSAVQQYLDHQTPHDSARITTA